MEGVNRKIPTLAELAPLPGRRPLLPELTAQNASPRRI